MMATVATRAQRVPAFDVASVKPQREPLTAENVVSGAIPRALPGGRFNHSHVTVEALLTFAWDLRPHQVVGAPDWVRNDRFAIDAKAGRDVPPGQITLMVQALLEDRFKLVAHIEPREMRVQALYLAKTNKALGPGLFRMDDECTPGVVNALRKELPEKYLLPRGSGGGATSCSPSGVGMLAEYLTLRLGTPVVDATGLEGAYYYLLSAELPPMVSGLGAPKSDSPTPPALSTALEEQLGLKMESRRVTVPVLVIDSIQQPTEN
jgi:uncharacterized protein (TIGR03435 family)